MVKTLKQKKLKIKKYIGLFFLILTSLFLWQLYRAPIALPFLKPYIIKALNHDDANFIVTLDSVNLELVRSIKPIKIIANNVEYKTSSDTFYIKAPKVSVSFSMTALLNGVVAPSAIEVMSPNIYIFKTYGIKKEKDVSRSIINEKKIESYITSFDSFMERFNSKEKIYSESYINNITISDASLEYHEIELGKKYMFTDINYAFQRGYNDMTISFSTFLNKKTQIGLNLEYRPTLNKLAIDLFASDFNPSKVIGPIFETTIDTPISGKIQTIVDINKIIEHKDNVLDATRQAISKIIFEFKGDNGVVTFADLEDYVYNISNISLKGDIQGGLDKLEINNARFNIDNQDIAISFNASGMKNLLLNGSKEDIKLSVNTKINSLPFDKLTKLWPKYISQEGWTWCNESLIGGFANNVDFNFNFAYDKDKKSVSFKELIGKVDVYDTSVFYLDGMPWIKNVYGVANFNNDEIKIDIEKGISDGVSLNGGYVKLYDLAKNDPAIDILLKAGGTLKNALKLISNKPLELTQDFGLNPDAVKGYADIELGLKFLLLNDIKTEDVNVTLKALAEDVFIPDVYKSYDFSAPALDLNLNNSSMNVSGAGALDSIPVDLVWTETFSETKEVNSEYNLKFHLTESLKKKLDIDFAVLTAPYIFGSPYIDANIKVLSNDNTKIDLTADLSKNTLDFAFLGIVKKKGDFAQIKTSLDMINNKISKNTPFSFSKKDFDLKGYLTFNDNTRLSKIDIFEIKGAKTDASAKIDINYDNKKPFYNINITGNSYNLTDFFKKGDEIDYKVDEDNQEEDWLEDTNDTDIFISVRSLWTIKDFPINEFTGSAKMRNGVGIEDMHIIGYFDNMQKSQIKLDYEPRENEEFVLDIDSTNAGATLKVLGIYDNMKGGILKIQAKRNKDKVLIGHAKIRNTNIHNTPVLAKLLSVASLSGLVNMLTGEGIAFSHIDIPFDYTKKILTLKKAKANGNTMIITSNGTINRKIDKLDINGVIAPLGGLDSLLGQIPLLGSLLKGKDGTVFAANYSITGTADKPDVDINPFSALSPSSLKDLVGVNNDQ